LIGVYNLRIMLILALTTLCLLVSCSNQENIDRDSERLPVGIGDDQNSDSNRPPQPTPEDEEEEPPQKITQCELGEPIQGGICAGEINGYFLILRDVDETQAIHWGNELPYVSQYLTDNDGSHNTRFLFETLNTNAFAAFICARLNFQGHEDWYLPALSEKITLAQRLGPGSVNPVDNYKGNYWTSSVEGNEFYENALFVVVQTAVTNHSVGKNGQARAVRCVRRLARKK
jgi:hypothetical protein